MIAPERFEAIEEVLNEKGIVSTKDLAIILDVTETTVRRDCELLEQKGVLVRVRGGVKRNIKTTIHSIAEEKAMSERTEHYREKDAVCRKASFFVKDGDCVFLDGGTTLVPMVKYLLDKDVEIVTHSMLIAKAFSEKKARLHVLGGDYNTKYDMVMGSVTLTEMKRYNFSCSFIGCLGMSPEKEVFYTAEMDPLLIKEAAMERSVSNYLLLDMSKLFVSSCCSSIPTSKFDAVICNADIMLENEKLPSNFILE